MNPRRQGRTPEVGMTTEMDALGEPIAQACQTRKNRWQDRRQGRTPQAG